MVNIIAESELLTELQNNYNKNISLIKEIYPVLFNKLKENEDEIKEKKFIVQIFNGVKFVNNSSNPNLWLPAPEEEQLKLNDNEREILKGRVIAIVGLSIGSNLIKAKSIPIVEEVLRCPLDSRPIIPIYVIEKEISIFNLILCLYDLEGIIKDNRFVFFIGKEAINEFKMHISNDEIIPPQILISPNPAFPETIGEEIKNCIGEVIEKKNEEFKKIKSEVIGYYNNKDFEYYNNRFKDRNNLRILILTSRFSTHIKYAARDIKEGFSSIGCDVVVKYENNNMSSLTDSSLIKTIDNFKPDLIFIISHLRSEYPFIPKNIPFVTWVQDILPNLTDKENIRGIDKFDIIIEQGGLVKYGYKKENLYTLPSVISNTNIYHGLTLSKEDKEKYTCEVAYVSNHSYTAQQELDELKKILKDRQMYTNEIPSIIELIFQKVKKKFKKDKILFALYQYEEIIREVENELKVEIENKPLRDYILLRFYTHIGAKFFRQKPLLWLKEVGINLKLYGVGWKNHPELSPYAQGFIENGEELCKLFNAAKINLHIDFFPIHWRVYDCISAGGFVLFRYTPLCELNSEFYEEYFSILDKINSRKSINEITANFKNEAYSIILRNIYHWLYNKINDDILEIDEIKNNELNNSWINLWVTGNKKFAELIDLISYKNLPQIYYKNKDELIQKVRYYLKNEDERIEITNNLSKFFRENFSHIKFCEQILDIAHTHFSNY